MQSVKLREARAPARARHGAVAGRFGLRVGFKTGRIGLRCLVQRHLLASRPRSLKGHCLDARRATRPRHLRAAERRRRKHMMSARLLWSAQRRSCRCVSSLLCARCAWVICSAEAVACPPFPVQRSWACRARAATAESILASMPRSALVFVLPSVHVWRRHPCERRRSKCWCRPARPHTCPPPSHPRESYCQVVVSCPFCMIATAVESHSSALPQASLTADQEAGGGASASLSGRPASSRTPSRRKETRGWLGEPPRGGTQSMLAACSIGGIPLASVSAV